MIIFTDGEDQGSRLRIQDAIEAAQKADTICYVILIADRGFYGGFGYSGDSDMHKLAEATGGRVIEVGNKQDKLKQAFDQIQNELRSQYNSATRPPIASSTAPIARSRSTPKATTRSRRGKATTPWPKTRAGDRGSWIVDRGSLIVDR